MTFEEKLAEKNRDIIDSKFEIIDISGIPRLDDRRLRSGRTALRFNAVVLFVDLIGSSGLLQKHNARDASKILMLYYNTVCRVANEYGGVVKSFNGDSLLAFFTDCSDEGVNRAVMAAMVLKDVISQSVSCLNDQLREAYEGELDYGIGIDIGEVLCTRTEAPGGEDGDVLWLADCINRASRISQTRRSIYNIGVTSAIENVLSDEMRYNVSTDALGAVQRKDMWSPGSFVYAGSSIVYYFTSYFWKNE